MVVFLVLLSMVLGVVVVGACCVSKKLMMSDKYGRLGVLEAFVMGYVVLVVVMFFCLMVKIWMGGV